MKIECELCEGVENVGPVIWTGELGALVVLTCDECDARLTRGAPTHV